MVASQQLTVAKDLRTELNNNGQNDVKIFAFDHNFADVYGYLPTIMNDSGGYAAVDGTAFHDYSGAPSAMTDMHNSYPGKGVQVTERSVWGVAGSILPQLGEIVQRLGDHARQQQSAHAMERRARSHDDDHERELSEHLLAHARILHVGSVLEVRAAGRHAHQQRCGLVHVGH
jgi:hypothetical protein